MFSTVTEWIDEILSSVSLLILYKTTIACGGGPVFNVLQNRNES